MEDRRPKLDDINLLATVGTVIGLSLKGNVKSELRLILIFASFEATSIGRNFKIGWRTVRAAAAVSLFLKITRA